MLHKRFTCVHLLATHLANLTEGFQLSFTTNVFPREQHKVVCNQSSTKWFAINACTSNAVGLLPSLRKLLTDSTERATSKCHFIIVTHDYFCKDSVFRSFFCIFASKFTILYDLLVKYETKAYCFSDMACGTGSNCR